MASSYYGSEMDNPSNEGTKQTSSSSTSPQPLAAPLLPPNGTANATSFGTSITAGGVYQVQSDGSTVGVNPILDQSYQSQQSYQPYSYYGQPSVYDNQTSVYTNYSQQQNVYDKQSGAYVNYSDMQQSNQLSYANYSSSGVGQLPGVFDASSLALAGTSYRAATPLLAVPVAPTPQSLSTGSEPAIVVSQLVPVQENASFVIGTASVVSAPQSLQVGSGPAMVASQFVPVQKDAISASPAVSAPQSPPVGSEPTVAASPLALVQENAMGVAPVASVSQSPQACSGSTMVVSQPAPIQESTAGLNVASLDPSLNAPAGPTEPNDSTGPVCGGVRLGKCYCGIRRRTCLFIAIGVCVFIALLLFFIWPRIPSIELEPIRIIERTSFTPSSYSSGSTFKGKWEVNFSLDNGNFVPWSFEIMSVTVYFTETIGDTLIGSGRLRGLEPPHGESTVSIPVDIYYSGSVASDVVLIAMNNSCTNGTHLQIRLHVEMRMSGLGLEGSKDFRGYYACKSDGYSIYYG
jgi:hypothetical protein